MGGGCPLRIGVASVLVDGAEFWNWGVYKRGWNNCGHAQNSRSSSLTHIAMAAAATCRFKTPRAVAVRYNALCRLRVPLSPTAKARPCRMAIIGTEYIGSVLRHEDILVDYHTCALAPVLVPRTAAADARTSASAMPSPPTKSPQLPLKHLPLSTGRTLKRTRAPEDCGEAPLAPRLRPTSSEVLHMPAFIL